MRTVYLLIQLRELAGQMPLVVRVGVYGEEHPTVLRGDHYVLVASARGSSFESAQKRLLDGVGKRADLKWLLPYVDSF